MLWLVNGVTFYVLLFATGQEFHCRRADLLLTIDDSGGSSGSAGGFSLIASHLLHLAVGLSAFAHGHDVLRRIPGSR